MYGVTLKQIEPHNSRSINSLSLSFPADNDKFLITNSSKTGLGEDQAQDKINMFNTAEIGVITDLRDAPMSWNPLDNSITNEDQIFGNWRKERISGINVNNHVLLKPEDTLIKFSASQTFESFWDAVMGNKLFSALDQGAQNIRMLNAASGGEVKATPKIPKYKKVPVLKDIGTLTVPSTIKFNFQFGQAGLFSASEEVVKPILAIIKCFIPKYEGNTMWVSGSAPSTEYALSEGVRGMFSNLATAAAAARYGNPSSSPSSGAIQLAGQAMGAVKDAMSGLGTAGIEGFANVLTDFQNKLALAITSTIEDQLSKGGFKGVLYRIGRFQLPPLIVKDLSFEFDFSTVDEYGFPYKGSVSLDGLESLVVANNNQISC